MGMRDLLPGVPVGSVKEPSPPVTEEGVIFAIPLQVSLSKRVPVKYKIMTTYT